MASAKQTKAGTRITRDSRWPRVGVEGQLQREIEVATSVEHRNVICLTMSGSNEIVAIGITPREALRLIGHLIRAIWYVRR